MIADLPPAAVLILGALLVPLLRGRTRSVYVLLLPVVSFAHLLSLGQGEFCRVSAFSYELTVVRIDALSRLFAILFHIAAFIGLQVSLGVLIVALAYYLTKRNGRADETSTWNEATETTHTHTRPSLPHSARS